VEEEKENVDEKEFSGEMVRSGTVTKASIKNQGIRSELNGTNTKASTKKPRHAIGNNVNLRNSNRIQPSEGISGGFFFLIGSNL